MFWTAGVEQSIWKAEVRRSWKWWKVDHGATRSILACSRLRVRNSWRCKICQATGKKSVWWPMRATVSHASNKDQFFACKRFGICQGLDADLLHENWIRLCMLDVHLSPIYWSNYEIYTIERLWEIHLCMQDIRLYAIYCSHSVVIFTIERHSRSCKPSRVSGMRFFVLNVENPVEGCELCRFRHDFTTFATCASLVLSGVRALEVMARQHANPLQWRDGQPWPP